MDLCWCFFTFDTNPRVLSQSNPNETLPNYRYSLNGRGWNTSLPDREIVCPNRATAKIISVYGLVDQRIIVTCNERSGPLGELSSKAHSVLFPTPHSFLFKAAKISLSVVDRPEAVLLVSLAHFHYHPYTQQLQPPHVNVNFMHWEVKACPKIARAVLIPSN